MEAGYEASVGARGIARARRMVEEVDRIAVQTADPYVTALERMIEGFIDYHEGKFGVAAENLERMESEFRALPGTYFEQVFCHCFAKICTRNRGRLGELQAGFFDWTRDAERRGDRFTEASLRLNLNGVWLARDEPGEALRDLGRVSWIPPEGGYHVQHWYERQARAEIALYTGEARPGLERFREAMKALSRSFILRMRLHRSHAHWLLGRLILQNAENDRPSRAALDEVRRIAKTLESEDVGFARTWSLLLTAGAEHQCGRTDAARRALEAAIAEAERHGLEQCEHAARYRLAELAPGDQRQALEERAFAWAAGQRIHDPTRMFRSWAPGLG
jgi:hypothetical protein